MNKNITELIGTYFLVITIGLTTGMHGTPLAPLAIGSMLMVMVYMGGPISGAHYNPAVTLAVAAQHRMEWTEVPGYVGAQIAGAFSGVGAAHLMFGETLFTASQHTRAGAAQMFSEFVATFGLLSIIWGCSRLRSEAVPFAVGAYITGAYWFTASTSFANPAVTLARSATNTFSGIRLIDAPGFIAAQLAGALAATLLWSWLLPSLPNAAHEVVLPGAERNIVHGK